MHKLTQTYNPALGRNPVEEQDYRILSLDDVRGRSNIEGYKMAVFAFGAVFVDIGILLGASYMRGQGANVPPPLEILFCVPAVAYGAINLAKHKVLSDAWRRAAKVMVEREKTHMLYLNPELENGTEPDVYPPTTIQRGHAILKRGLIPNMGQYCDRIIPAAATAQGPQLP